MAKTLGRRKPKSKAPRPSRPPAQSIEELRKSMPTHMTRNDRRRLKVFLEQTLDSALATRVCGECTACCTAMAIAELNKPCFVPCTHVTEHGCSIYSDRPPSCRAFVCAWRAGIGTDDQRPDRLGIVLSFAEANHPAHPAVFVHEISPNSINENADAIGPYLRDLASRMVVVFVRDGLLKSFAGPDHRIIALQSFIEENRRINAAVRAARSLASP